MTYKFHKKVDGIDFYAPSKTKDKKYDAVVEGKKYSFGNKNYEQYHDKISYYKDLNHEDKQRRENYRARHKHDKLNTYSSGFFAWHYLW